MPSDIGGLYRLDRKKRRRKLLENTPLGDEDLALLDPVSAGEELLDGMIENVVGGFVLPIGVVTNLRVNGVDRLVPMATEEASVVAAASRGCKIAREAGGFEAVSTDPVMIGQIQIADLSDPRSVMEDLKGKKEELMGIANRVDPVLVRFGGGVKDIEFRRVVHPKGEYLVLHLMVDCRDAMGANAVNTMAEALAPVLEDLTGGRVVLRIISNLADRRLATARALFKKDLLGGQEVLDSILDAYHLAEVDPYRCATHNKGIMNGVSAVVRATGNDTRAVESGAHSFAARDGSYRPLTSYWKDEGGDLIGEITIPVPVGTVGGATRVHPAAIACLKMMGLSSARELGEVLAAVGLAQNLAALRALASEGIQRGHMRLHARNLALQAGAREDEVERLVEMMVGEKTVTASKAEELLRGIR